MKIDDKIIGEILQMVFTEEPQNYSHQAKLNYTNYCSTKIVELNDTNYFLGIQTKRELQQTLFNHWSDIVYFKNLYKLASDNPLHFRKMLLERI